MGRVKDWMIQEESRKIEAMETMPDRLDDAIAQIDELRNGLEKSSVTISILKDDLEEANSFKSKMKDYLIGGLIGAVIGIILSILFL
jgi:chromosome segregation ATPase